MVWRNNLASELLYKISLLLSFIILLVSSWNAPMSGDEYVHVQQAEKNINYLKSLGADKEALKTPISRLKHYGQSFDTITTGAAHVLGIDNVYQFRHVSNAIVAWLVILFTTLTVLKISKNYFAGFITVILFLVSMRFMGHAMNNLKDIPFAFAFIFSIFFIIRFLENIPKISLIDLIGIILGIAFGISIRIGGLLIFAYFILFAGLYFYYFAIRENLSLKVVLSWIWKLGILSIFIFVFSYVLGILLWPWALENPVTHPLESLALMHQYPTTVRQIFEGELYWSDRFPWYYLFKYLLITLPLIVIVGFGSCFLLMRKVRDQNQLIYMLFIFIAFGFPLFYTSVSGANVYGGWRQVLFIFPPLVVLSSIGISLAAEKIRNNVRTQVGGIVIALILLYHPVRFFILNYPYHYVFFNPLVGGVKGAYGNYELDYYFTSFKEAYAFIDNKINDQPKIVAANFIIPEYYKGKNYKPVLIDYYNRSIDNWDYAIICNTFLDPYHLKESLWPPDNTIFTEDVEGRPILAIIKRASKVDYEGIKLLEDGDIHSAIIKLNQALEIDPFNESILVNLIRAYLVSNELDEALISIDMLQDIYPNFEWARDLKGEVFLKMGKVDEALEEFRENIRYNHKFFHSYTNLAHTYLAKNDEEKAINQLKTCLRINPFYEPAYHLYGKILVDRGEVELGRRMIEYSNEGDSKYGEK